MVSVPLGVRRCSALILLALATAACSSGATGSVAPATPASDATAAPATAPAEEPAASEAASQAPAPPAQPAVGEAGSFTVEGTEYAVTMLNRCIPFSDAPGNIDLQALATGAQLNLGLLGSNLDVSVQGLAIQEAFGSIAFGKDAVVESSDVTADRWTGAATVGDSLGSGTTVALTWDVMVPGEVKDCSL